MQRWYQSPKFSPYVVLVLLFPLLACALPAWPANQPPQATPIAANTAEPSLEPSPVVLGELGRADRPPLEAPPTREPEATPVPEVTFEPLKPTPTLVPLSESERKEVFEDVWSLVNERYIYTDFHGVDWDHMRGEYGPKIAAAETPEQFYRLMKEMMALLDDDHSVYETPQEVAEQQAIFDGQLEYAGIGAVIRTVEEGGLIMQLATGSPAEEAGLKPRELVVAIGTIPFTDTEAFGPGGPIGSVRGLPGTSVELTIRGRDGVDRQVEIVRRPVASGAFSDVEAQRLPDSDIVVLRVSTFFIDDLDGLIRAEIERELQAGPISALLVDVRDNGGGRVDYMLNSVGLFAEDCLIGSTESRRGDNELYTPYGLVMPEIAELPVAVLINDGSVSAAEMFAAGMRECIGAKLVGMTTAGNTENLRGYTLADGSELWLAELIYILPNGEPNEGKGVEPDRSIDAEWWRFDPQDDPHVQAAIELLTQN
jgi:carboxyl-terminal processing protease